MRDLSVRGLPVRIDAAVRDAIVGHAEACRPDEACGLLVGRASRDGVRVDRAVAAANVWEPPAERPRRYALAPAEQVAAERAARADGSDVVGYYHSHPASDPVPSGVDRGLAWPRTVYLIVGLAGDGPVLRAWMLDDDGDDAGFVECTIDAAG